MLRKTSVKYKRQLQRCDKKTNCSFAAILLPAILLQRHVGERLDVHSIALVCEADIFLTSENNIAPQVVVLRHHVPNVLITKANCLWLV